MRSFAWSAVNWRRGTSATWNPWHSLFRRALEDCAGELSKGRYRDPDTVVGPSKVLADLIPEFSKRPGARAMGGRLTRSNRSRSYRVFLEGVERQHRRLVGA